MCRGVAWELHVDVLQEDQTYKISNITVQSFNGTKYMSVAENSLIKKTEDIIGEVVDETLPNDRGEAKVIKAEIVGVIGLESYKSCRNCHAKVAEKMMFSANATNVGQRQKTK